MPKISPGVFYLLILVSCCSFVPAAATPSSTHQVADVEISEPSAFALYEAGDFKTALQVCNKLLTTDQNANLFYLRGRSCLALERFGDADADFQKCLERCPSNKEALLNRANIHWCRKENGVTFEILSRGIQAADSSPQVRKAVCKWLKQVMCWDELGKQADAALKKYPNEAQFWMFLAFATEATGKGREFNKIRSSVMQAINLEPDQAELYGDAAEILARQDQIPTVNSLLQLAAKRCADPLVVRYGRVRMFDVRGDASSAKAERAIIAKTTPGTRADLLCIQENLRNGHMQENSSEISSNLETSKHILLRDQNDVEETLLLAKLLSAKQGKQVEETIRLTRKLLKDYPTARNYHFAGCVLGSFGDQEHEFEYFDRACRLDPFNSEAVFARSKILLKRKQTEKALAELDRTVILAPDNVFARIDRAQVLSMLGKTAELDRELVELRRLGSNYTRADIEHRAAQFSGNVSSMLTNLGFLASTELTKEIHTLELQRKAGSLAPELVLRLADLYTLDRKYDKALQEYDKAIQSSPQDYHLYSKRGAIYYAMGKSEKAQADRTEAKRLFHESFLQITRRGR